MPDNPTDSPLNAKLEMTQFPGGQLGTAGDLWIDNEDGSKDIAIHISHDEADCPWVQEPMEDVAKDAPEDL